MASQVWVDHPDRVWVPCKVKSSRTDDATLVTDEGENIVVPTSKLKTLQQVQEDQINGVDDICSLAVVNEGTLLHTVRIRYFKQLIYTRVSKILIAINPFTSLPIYSAQYMEQYKGESASGELPPHIFGIGKDALTGLRDRVFDQAVLISGESGAGKTESAKLILSFVADAVKTDVDGGIESLVLQTNPILEAFGNAMTARNNNSSRFGKWLDLRFSPELDIIGCSLESYLLETTRVCGQASNERGFHVFFQLLQARDNPDFADLKLLPPKKYNFLANGRPKADGINDSRNFEELQEAMRALGWGSSTQNEIFSILTAILELGNADFQEKGEGAQFSDEAAVRRFSTLLDIDPDDVIHRLLHKKITVGKDVTEVPLRLGPAIAFRDALARLLYDRLFLWLIKTMNTKLIIDERALEERRRSSCHSRDRSRAQRKTIGGQERKLGILDIAGFECFEHNSLEQMLINLSNENLQQHFNQSFLKAEVEDCEKEGVQAPQGLDYNDNADCLALFDARGGILDLLEEEMAVPKASDQSFIAKVLKNHDKHARIIKSRVASDGFGIKHFAGEVKYDATGWLDKNAGSSTSPELATIFEDSSLEIIFDLGATISGEIKEAAGGVGGRGKKIKSASGGFRKSLRELMTKIGKADPHYVRCVKPNTSKVPEKFTAQMVMEQLRFSGVLAAVQIRQQGFAIRTLKDEFLARYRCIVDRLCSEKKPVKDVENLVERLPDVLKESGIDVKFNPKSFAIGKTKIFQKVEAFESLEKARQQALGSSALTLQRICRGYFSRKKTNIIRDLTRQLTKCLARLSKDLVGRQRARTTSWVGDSIFVQVGTREALERLINDLQQILALIEDVPFKNGTSKEAQQIVRRANLELAALIALEPFAASKDVVGMEAVLARCKALKLPETGDVFKVQKRVKQLKVQIPLIRAMKMALVIKKISIPASVPQLESATEADDREAAELSELKAEADEAGLDKGNWLPELGGADLYGKVVNELEKNDGVGRAESNGHTKPSAENAQQELMAARKTAKKVTITGLDPVEQAVLMAGLRRAADDLDGDALKDLLSRALEEGLDTVDEAGVQEGLSAARKVFEELQNVDFIVEKMDELCAEASAEQPSLRTLRQLEQVLLQLRQIPGYEEQCLLGSRALQQAVAAKRVKRKSTRVSFAAAVGSASSLTDEQVETDLATRIFRNLEEYGRLKPSTTWLGHARKSFPRRQKTFDDAERIEAKASGDKGMLTHSKIVIAEALTVTPVGCDEEEYEAGALQNFWNVLVWMSDRPAQECQRIAARNAIIGLANDVPFLRPEVYIQVLKQLIRNPTPRSAILGWELLQSLCKEAPPDNELVEFVKAFINGGGAELVGSNPGHRLHSESLARACLLILDRGAAATTSSWDSIWRSVYSSIMCAGCRDRRPIGPLIG